MEDLFDVTIADDGSKYIQAHEIGFSARAVGVNCKTNYLIVPPNFLIARLVIYIISLLCLGHIISVNHDLFFSFSNHFNVCFM